MHVLGSVSGRSVQLGLLKWLVAAALLAGAPSLGLAGKPPSTPAPPPPQEVHNQFFDWFVNDTPGYLPSPFLSDQSADSVNAFLKRLPANQPKAVKVEGPLSSVTANLIFNNPDYQISYVLGDIEQHPAQPLVRDLARQVRFVNGQNNGTRTRSHNAFIGSFGFQKVANDFTMPKNYSSQKDEHSFAGYNLGAYNGAKLNMSMPELYPGSPSYRNPAAGNSDAPNIRSAMFTLPILRLSQATVNTDSDERIIPWVARFNNFNNLALDTDRNPTNLYRFETGKPLPGGMGFPSLSASDTKDQLLSRRDFATLVAHYRLRGADSYVLFEPGVVGYTNEQKRADAKTGWTHPNIDRIFGADDHTLVLGKETDYRRGRNTKDINSVLFVDGKEQSAEETGSIFSGVYSLSLNTMDILLSNMDEVDHTLTLPRKIGGFDLKTTSFTLDAGTHLLVEFKLSTSGPTKGWSVAMMQVPFRTLNNSRNGIGIPEPTTLTLAAVTGFILIGPRRRRRRLAA